MGGTEYATRDGEVCQQNNTGLTVSVAKVRESSGSSSKWACVLGDVSTLIDSGPSENYYCVQDCGSGRFGYYNSSANQLKCVSCSSQTSQISPNISLMSMVKGGEKMCLSGINGHPCTTISVGNIPTAIDAKPNAYGVYETADPGTGGMMRSNILLNGQLVYITVGSRGYYGCHYYTGSTVACGNGATPVCVRYGGSSNTSYCSEWSCGSIYNKSVDYVSPYFGLGHNNVDKSKWYVVFNGSSVTMNNYGIPTELKNSICTEAACTGYVLKNEQ
jgi:hypothetical protein